MAFERRVQYALDNFLNPKIFDSQKNSYELIEKSDSGKAKIFLKIDTSDNICVKNYDNITWNILRDEKELHMRQCIDHFILKKNSSDIWELHMFEMKKSITPKTWRDVKNQMRASYFTIKSITTFLGIEVLNENIFMYTAYGNDEKINLTKLGDNSVSKTFKTGLPLINFKNDEWDADAIFISLINSEGEEQYIRFKHTKIKMQLANDGFLERTFTLP